MYFVKKMSHFYEMRFDNVGNYIFCLPNDYVSLR